MNLDTYSTNGFHRGAPRSVEAIWLIGSALVASGLPGSGWRCALLRLFGATIGMGAVLKPGIKVKFPWRLILGNHVWIGERVWIDNLAQVKIGNHVCISQGAYLCTGSHNWSREDFRLIVKGIDIQDHVWICASVNVAPGTTIEKGAVVSMGGLAQGQLKKWTVYAGTPALPVKKRPHPLMKASEKEQI